MDAPLRITISRACKAAGYRNGYADKTISSSPMTIRRFIPPHPKRLDLDNWYV